MLSFLIFNSIAVIYAQWYPGYMDMLNAVNSHRAQNGKAALCISNALMTSAKYHSDYLASINQQSHDDPRGFGLGKRMEDGGFPGFQSGAENVADSDKQTDFADVENRLYDDPPHRDNILGDYTHFGSAASQGSDGKWYWTQHFAVGFDSVPCDASASTSNPAPSLSPQKPASPLAQSSAGGSQPGASSLQPSAGGNQPNVGQGMGSGGGGNGGGAMPFAPRGSSPQVIIPFTTTPPTQLPPYGYVATVVSNQAAYQQGLNGASQTKDYSRRKSSSDKDHNRHRHRSLSKQGDNSTNSYNYLQAKNTRQ